MRLPHRNCVEQPSTIYLDFGVNPVNLTKPEDCIPHELRYVRAPWPRAETSTETIRPISFLHRLERTENVREWPLDLIRSPGVAGLEQFPPVTV